MKIKKLEAENKSSESIIVGLENKLRETESILTSYTAETKGLRKALENEVENCKVLKTVINKKNDEYNKNKNDIDAGNKTIKSKDKEIHKLERKVENQNDSIQRLKVDLNKLKEEKKKSEKKLKQEQDKAKKLGRKTDGCNNLFSIQTQTDSSQRNANEKPSENLSIVSPVDTQTFCTPQKVENEDPLIQEDSIDETEIECQICG